MQTSEQNIRNNFSRRQWDDQNVTLSTMRAPGESISRALIEEASTRDIGPSAKTVRQQAPEHYKIERN